MEKIELSFAELNQEQLKTLCGVNNRNIKLLEELFAAQITNRGNIFIVPATIVSQFTDCLNQLIISIDSQSEIDENFIKQTVKNIMLNNNLVWQNKVAYITYTGKPIKYKTYKQYQFAKSLDNNDLVFSVGPAGTGKTYLAVLFAVKALKNGDVKKIILTRPAVEAGESLGFLPGDLKEKIDPYLMPLYDSLYDLLGEEQVEKLIDKKIIEVIPLAYMRGRTLNDAFIILDEAQNTTSGQMLMFLTRLGYNSKMIVNGDVTQIDLNISKNKSGLVVACEKLQDIKKLSFVEFEKDDIVRNPLVEKIITKYCE